MELHIHLCFVNLPNLNRPTHEWKRILKGNTPFDRRQQRKFLAESSLTGLLLCPPCISKIFGFQLFLCASRDTAQRTFPQPSGLCVSGVNELRVLRIQHLERLSRLEGNAANAIQEIFKNRTFHLPFIISFQTKSLCPFKCSK